jgi:NADH-quinone oxidoreductase subunit J
MLLNLNEETEPLKAGLVKGMGVIAGMCLLITLAGSLKVLTLSAPVEIIDQEMGLVRNLGKVLFSDFLLPFEISSLLLLTAMVGAVLLAKKDTKKA